VIDLDDRPRALRSDDPEDGFGATGPPEPFAE